METEICSLDLKGQQQQEANILFHVCSRLPQGLIVPRLSCFIFQPLAKQCVASYFVFYSVIDFFQIDFFFQASWWVSGRRTSSGVMKPKKR